MKAKAHGENDSRLLFIVFLKHYPIIDYFFYLIGNFLEFFISWLLQPTHVRVKLYLLV